MAKAAQVEPPPAAEPVEAPPPRRAGSRKLIVIAASALLLVGAAAGAAWHFSQSADAEVPVAKGKSAAKGKDKAPEKERKPSVFMSLDTFTVNLQEESGPNYLQTSIVFEVADEKTAELVKTQMPVIRSKILLLLSSKRPSEIKTPEGKEKLALDLADEARRHMPVKAPELALTNVHFNSFVIQ